MKPESILEIVALAKKMNSPYTSFSVHHPFPGTMDYEIAKADGMLVGDYAPYEPRPWMRLPWMEDISELHACSKWAYESYYRRLSYVKKYVKSVLRDRNWNPPVL